MASVDEGRYGVMWDDYGGEQWGQTVWYSWSGISSAEALPWMQNGNSSLEEQRHWLWVPSIPSLCVASPEVRDRPADGLQGRGFHGQDVDGDADFVYGKMPTAMQMLVKGKGEALSMDMMFMEG